MASIHSPNQPSTLPHSIPFIHSFSKRKNSETHNQSSAWHGKDEPETRSRSRPRSGWSGLSDCQKQNIMIGWRAQHLYVVPSTNLHFFIECEELRLSNDYDYDYELPPPFRNHRVAIAAYRLNQHPLHSILKPLFYAVLDIDSSYQRPFRIEVDFINTLKLSSTRSNTYIRGYLRSINAHIVYGYKKVRGLGFHSIFMGIN